MTTASGMTLEAIAAGDGGEITQFDEERRSIVLCAIAGLFLHMPAARVARLSARRTALALRFLMVTRRPHGNMFRACSVEMCSCSSGGGAIATEACSTSVESGDGRTVFPMSPNGQLKMPRLGNS